MKKQIAVLVSIGVLSSLALVGCNQVSPGPTSTREFSIEDFSNLQISSAFQVDVVRSDEYSVSVTAPERMFNDIKVEKTGETLKVRMDPAWTGWFRSWGARPKATVTMPVLNTLDISGASRVTAKGFQSVGTFKTVISGASNADVEIEAGEVSVDVSGASRLEGRLMAKGIRMEVTGASRVDLEGAGESLTVGASGASNADLEALSVRQAKVTLSGASRASVAPEDAMTVSLSGASRLAYTGSPALEGVDVSGASTLEKK